MSSAVVVVYSKALKSNVKITAETKWSTKGCRGWNGMLYGQLVQSQCGTKLVSAFFKSISDSNFKFPASLSSPHDSKPHHKIIRNQKY